MKYLWAVVTVLSLVACGSGKAPPPDKYARFVGNTGEQLQTDKRNFEAYQSIFSALAKDPFMDIVLQIFGLSDHRLDVNWSSACLVDVLAVDNKVVRSQLHSISPDCDCLSVASEEATKCIGEALPVDAQPVFVQGNIKNSDELLKLFRFAAENLCPALAGVQGIPFIPPDCLGGTPALEVLPNLSIASAVNFFGGVSVSLEAFPYSGVLPSSVAPYITANGEQSQVYTFKNVINKYEDCALDAQLVFSIDDQGNLIPAHKVEPVSDIVKPEVYRTIETYLVSEQPKTCSYTEKAATANSSNSTDIDNALSPYEGLDITITSEFGVLEEGVLNLDYESRFYRVPRQ